MPNHTGKNQTPDHIKERIVQDWDNGERNQTALARRYNVDVGTVVRALNKHYKAQGLETPYSAKTAKIKGQNIPEYVNEPTIFKENGDEATFSGVTTEPIKTLEDAVRVAQIDLSVWFVDRWETSHWTVPMMVKNGQEVVKLASLDNKTVEALKWNSTNPIQTQQYRVKLYLKRIMKRTLHEAHNAIMKRMDEHSPTHKKYTYKKSHEETLAVMCLFDAHFGKLAWDKETGNSYDIKIAETIYSNAVIDLIAKSNKVPTRWLMPIGNDFYHMDNMYNTTFAGTPQDVDGRYAKIIESGEMAVINAIEMMLESAPVDVLWIPGNHDLTTSYHLARTINAWFRRTDKVKVDYSPTMRKYYHWYNTLLGLTHGNEEKKDILPSLMSTERPIEWAASKCREWLIGHDHRSRKWVTQPTDTYEGTTVRTVRSIAGTDLYHFKKGYVGAEPASEIYYYDQEYGYSGHWIAPVRM